MRTVAVTRVVEVLRSGSTRPLVVETPHAYAAYLWKRQRALG